MTSKDRLKVEHLVIDCDEFEVAIDHIGVKLVSDTCKDYKEVLFSWDDLLTWAAEDLRAHDSGAYLEWLKMTFALQTTVNKLKDEISAYERRKRMPVR